MLHVARPTEAMDYWYRFAHGDDVIFIHDGTGVLESQFGDLRYRPGDYLVIPTGVLWRLIPDAGVEQRQFHIETLRPYRTAKALSEIATASSSNIPPSVNATFVGLRRFRPETKKVSSRCESRRVARSPATCSVTTHSMWLAGTGISGPTPSTSKTSSRSPVRVHQPPPVHQTFDGPGFVICSFVPRLYDYHPEAIPAPYNHSNVDSDEVLYYVEGQFMSRKGIDRASLTVHPERHSSRPSSGNLRRFDRQGGDRGARRDGRYLPPAPSDSSRHGARRSRLRHELDRPFLTLFCCHSLLLSILSLRPNQPEVTANR